ncbi:unnamed protein product [Orchesella dallaii]|uniref:Uncharacterized protein n=1 Tax=Orchesella dallaii TaxID=48710 RepID=A0ABP1RXW1_9HEXA
MATSSTALTAQHFDAEINILLVGDSGVGKTALLDQFWGPYSKDTAMARIRYFEVGWKMSVLVRFRDPFCDKLVAKKESLVNKADGVLLIYDVTNETSFDSIKLWMNTMKRVGCKYDMFLFLLGFDIAVSPLVEMMIVGNKSDLVEQRALALREMSTVTFNQEPFLWLCMCIYSQRKLRIQGLIEKQRKEEQEKSNEKTHF